MSFIMEILQNIMLLLGFVGGGSSFPKPLSSEEEKKYIDLMEKGDERAKNILIEHNLRLVAHIAKKYATESNFDDLVSAGTIGLIKGINTFDRTKTSKLTTYIARCIENEVLMVLRASKKSAGDVSLEECIGVDKEGNNMTFSDVLPADTDDITDIIALKVDIKRLYKAIDNVLSPDEKKILFWRYGLGKEKKRTQREIAKSLGISRSYVSRIEKRAIKKLSVEIKE